jgi:pyruvate dehydrogenase (quinone)
MSQTVGDFLVKRLTQWDVKRVYGISGEGINGILAALDRAGNQPEFIQVPHEEMASLAACAEAKYTGNVGVCLGTSGPGSIHLVTGLYDANLDHQPVVAILGQQPRRVLGGRYIQEIDLASVFKDVASAYIQVMMSPAQLPHVLERAFRIASVERTVTCVIIPADIQEMEAVEELPAAMSSVHPASGRPRVVPSTNDLERAADVLNAGQKVAMLVGAGALNATDEVIAVAERLGAGVAKALLGKAAVPDDLPFVTGSVGWLGTDASNAMLRECDTLFMVGSSFPYTDFLPAPGQARGVQIDIDGRMLSLRYPMEANLIGDSAETLRALLPLLAQKPNQTWRQWVESQVAQWRQTAADQARRPANPLNPQLVFAELSQRLPEQCILAGDCGSSTVWYARFLQVRRGMMGSLSGTLQTMGSALPYALAAKFAYPERPVVAFCGDGAMQMIGINGLISVSKFWQRWRDPRLVVLVLNNRDLNYVTWEQQAMEGGSKFDASQDLIDLPYARYAELLGLKGITVESPEAVGPALDEALSADRPVVVEAITDANIPTLPPHLQPR